jgi:4-coumarate--CoA ligase
VLVLHPGQDTMVYKSPYPSLELPQTNLLHYLFPEGEEPQSEPLWFDTRNDSVKLSPKDALQWVKRLSLGLTRLRLNRGDVVMIYTPNQIFVPVAYLGIVGGGFIFSGANPGYTVPGTSGNSDGYRL